jgi:hypothetical protein
MASVAPNPFSSSTTVRFHQPNDGDVVLRIIDGTGRIVQLVSGGYRSRGEVTLMVECGGLATGTYYYELNAGGTTARGMMTIVR